MKIDIICPLYNASRYIIDLNNSFLMQENVIINKVRYVLTESNDNTKEIMDNANIQYTLIKKSEFSHSLVREKAAMESDADIVVFVTQDVVITDKLWLYNLTKDINDEVVEKIKDIIKWI